jgi:hypothetical protein
MSYLRSTIKGFVVESTPLSTSIRTKGGADVGSAVPTGNIAHRLHPLLPRAATRACTDHSTTSSGVVWLLQGREACFPTCLARFFVELIDE